MPTARALLQGPIAAAVARLAWPVLIVLALQTRRRGRDLLRELPRHRRARRRRARLPGLHADDHDVERRHRRRRVLGGRTGARRGRRADAESLATHAAVLGGAFGLAFTLGVWLGGPGLFRHMGAHGEALASAVLYANVMFLSAVPGWIANLLAAALRGAGNVRVPRS